MTKVGGGAEVGPTVRIIKMAAGKDLLATV